MQFINVWIMAFLLLVGCPVRAELSLEQAASKDVGIAAYRLGNMTTAANYLETVAEAGDADSQYYLGEIERKKNMLMTPVAKRWYESAAQQGDLYSMLRLITAVEDRDASVTDDASPKPKTSETWRGLALKTALARAKDKDGEAMEVLYYLTGDLNWLLMSAQSGFPQGQYQLAVAYSYGEGIFYSESARAKTIKKWIRVAANAGYGPARTALLKTLSKQYDLAEYRDLQRTAARSGDLDSTTEYSKWIHIDIEDDSLSSSYGLTLVVVEAKLAAGEKNSDKQRLNKLAEKMTPEQIEAGIAFAEEWKKTHPPLSRFLPKYGY
jgi:TPR repeat protein